MSKPHSHFRWIMISLLFFITVVNYIDRASIAYAMNSIALEFHFTQKDIGFILGAFGIGYTVTTFLGGIAADHFGARRTLTIATFFWGIATALTGVANGFLMMFVARVVLGLAEGPNFPSMTRAVSDWLPESERNRALSFALVSVPLSLAIGGPLISQLILLFSWRGMYFILTAIALLWMPIWWYLFRDQPSESQYVHSSELTYITHEATIKTHLTKGKSPWRVLLLNQTLLANNWAFFVFGFYLFFFMTWLPNYLSATYHFNLATIGLYSMIPWLLAALMIWVMGSVCDRIYLRTKSLRLSRSYPILLSQLLSALFVIPMIFTTSIVIVMTCLSLAVGFAMSANAAFYAVNVDIAKERAGTSLGIMDAVLAIAGFLAPTITGFMVSWTGQFSAVFWLLMGLALSSTLVTFLFHNRGASNDER